MFYETINTVYISFMPCLVVVDLVLLLQSDCKDKLRIHFEGKILDDAKTLAEYNMEESKFVVAWWQRCVDCDLNI